MTNARVPLNIKNARHRIERAQGAPYLAECLDDLGRSYDRSVPGYIWVREILSVDPDSGGVVRGQAYQVRATAAFIPYYGARVRVEFDEFDAEWGITQHDFKSLVEQGINPSVVNPLNPYTRNKNMDVIPILRSFAPSNAALPTTEVGIKNLVGIDYLGDMQAFRLADDSRPDIADYEPATEGQKRLVHLWLDYDNEIAVSQSTPVGSTDTFDTFIDLQETFDNKPNQLARPIGVWIAENGMTETTVSNYYFDTRQFINNPQPNGFPNPVGQNWVVPTGITETVHGMLTVTANLKIDGTLTIVDESENVAYGEVTAERVNSDLDNTQIQVFEEDGVNLITAVGGIDPDRTKYRIAGSGGPVTVTATPPITAGIGGQYLILEGEDDTNTVTLTKSSTLHLHGGSWVGGATDILVLMYCELFDRWKEVGRNNTTTEKSWNFASPFGTSGTFYEAGFYIFGSSNNDFSPSINFGTANAPYAAHFFVVTGATTVDELTIRVTGTSINDNGVRVTSDTDDIVIPNATPVDSYFESKKFIGQVSISVVSGTATQCNYGWSKYYDRNNTDFRITGLEALFTGGANDSNANLSLIHHKQTGWTYNAGAAPTPPAAIADMQTDYATEYQVKNNEPGAWKRGNLNTIVEGSAAEGIIIQIDTTANKTFEPGLNTFMVSLVPR
jgi:hypothetical protein